MAYEEVVYAVINSLGLAVLGVLALRDAAVKVLDALDEIREAWRRFRNRRRTSRRTSTRR
jgi:uncharacterized membrane protein